MVALQSTTIPLDFTHLEPKFQNGDRRTCFTHPVEDEDSISDTLLSTTARANGDSNGFDRFAFILQYSGLAEKYRRMNGYTLAVVPDDFMGGVDTLCMSRADARRIILRHTINHAIRLSDISCDLAWMQNGMDEFFTLSDRTWNDAIIMGTKQCSNGYIYIVDRLI